MSISLAPLASQTRSLILVGWLVNQRKETELTCQEQKEVARPVKEKIVAFSQSRFHCYRNVF